jgi:hypothetical protein
MNADRILIFFAGLAGAGGVALSAVAAHAGGQNLQTAATFLLGAGWCCFAAICLRAIILGTGCFPMPRRPGVSC